MAPAAIAAPTGSTAPAASTVDAATVPSADAVAASHGNYRDQSAQLVGRVNEVEASLQSFKRDAQHKDFRLKVKKSLNTKISQISATWNRIRDCTAGLCDELSQLLQDPDPSKCKFTEYAMAERLADDAEVGIKAQPRAAWPVAQVAVRVFVRFPAIEDLFWGFMYKACPYLIPNFAGSHLGRTGPAPGQRPEEPFTDFADRMVSYQRLRLAILVTRALFMALWVFVLPGSAWVGSSPDRDAWFLEVWQQYFQFFAPPSIVLKYNVAGPLIELAHAVPGAVWALLAPVQLDPESRKAGGGFLHRTAGRMMLLAAALLMTGYALIDGQRLFADEVDFAGHGGGLAAAADAFNAGQLGGVLPPFNLGGVRFLAAWFIFTAVQTFRTATSEPRDVEAHRCWALRHVAAGLWVAAQRPLYAVARLAQGVLLGADLAGTSSAQADAFYYCAYFTTALYIAAAEWAIWSGARGESSREPPASG